MSEYYIQNESLESKYKKECWETATGLQLVDGLIPSEYLYSLANRNINEEMSLKEIENLLYRHYENETEEDRVNRKKEADIVTTRITELLEDRTFTFSPEMLKFIHKTLFTGIYEHAGRFRECNISKKEPVLQGVSANYANYQMIEETYAYDFSQERGKQYANRTREQVIKGLAAFTSSVWQVHPFMEGNTRTTAVFLEKYLNSMGFLVDNTVFAKYSLYFRNALVRSNYANYKNGIDIDNSFLEKFFDNLLFSRTHELKNTDMIIKIENRN